MFDHILVTTDGSALGNLALPIAADLARKYGGSLTLLYVVPTPSPPPILSGGVAYMYVHTLPAESARLQREGQLILAEARKLLDVPGVQALCTEARGLIRIPENSVLFTEFFRAERVRPSAGSGNWRNVWWGSRRYGNGRNPYERSADRGG